MTGRVSNGKILALFKEWIIPHSKAVAAMDYLNDLREAKRNSRWDTEARGAHLLGPSHCGKSHIVNKIYFSHFVLPELRSSGEYDPSVSDGQIKKLQKKYLYLKVPEKPNLGDFGTSFLKSLGDPFAEKHDNVLSRIGRAEDIMNALGTELIALDNFDQLTKVRDRKTVEQASAVQEVVKNLLEKGFPIVFVGLYNARKTILQNMQLKNRSRELDILPLRWIKDAEEFYRYLAGLELLMLENVIFDKPSGLCDEYVAVRLYYASQGRLGVLSNIVAFAALIASKDRRPRIQIADLSAAVNQYSLKIKICRYNPFLVDDTARVERDSMTRVAEDEQHYDAEYMEHFR